MAMVNVQAHEVEAIRIVGIQPLISKSGNTVLAPDAGIVLVLEDGKQHTWLIETGGVTPAAGDVLVFDATLKVRYLVTAAQFAELFQTI